MQRFNPVLSESLLLLALGYPFELARVDIGIVIELVFIDCVINDLRSPWVFLGAPHMQLELDAIVLSVGVFWLF